MAGGQPAGPSQSHTVCSINESVECFQSLEIINSKSLQPQSSHFRLASGPHAAHVVSDYCMHEELIIWVVILQSFDTGQGVLWELWEPTIFEN